MYANSQGPDPAAYLEGIFSVQRINIQNLHVVHFEIGQQSFANTQTDVGIYSSRKHAYIILTPLNPTFI